MSVKSTNGSEIHRLKEFTHYNKDQFEKLYKMCKPLIKSLSRNIDSRRYNLSPDIIQSYFEDKFLFVYNKYQDQYDEERLKATLLRSLSTFKNKLLRNAYTKQSEFNQSLSSLDVLFDNDKELLDDYEETETKEEKSVTFHKYLESNLSPDEYLLFKTQLDPPPFILERMSTSQGKISTLCLIDFFELPRDKRAATYISNMRNNIKFTLEKAKAELPK